MRKQKFVIEGSLPSLNDYIRAERSTRYAAAEMKHSYENVIIGFIRKAKIRRVDEPVILHYKHFVQNRRKDRDNIASIAHKFTQDALVHAGVLRDDGWGEVLNSFDEWGIDKDNPRIEVEIEEVLWQKES